MNSSLPIETSIPDVNAIAGPKFIGAFFATVLWSASLAQVWTYMANYPKDRRFLKLWVVAVFVFATAGIILLVGSLYLNLVSHFGDVSFLLGKADPLASSQVAFTSVNSALVQSFFVYRIWRLSNNKVLAILLELCVVAQFCTFVVQSALLWGSTFHENKTFFILGSVIALALDSVLAVALIILLSRQAKSVTGRASTLVRRLMVFSLSSGLATATLVLLIFILFFASPHTTLFLGFYAPLQSLYANSMLAALNARSYFSQSIDETVQDQTHELTYIHFASMPKPTSTHGHGQSHTESSGEQRNAHELLAIPSLQRKAVPNDVSSRLTLEVCSAQDTQQ